VVLFITLVLQLASSDANVGVARVGEDGDLCVAMPKPVTIGTSVTLVDPGAPRASLTASIAQPSPSCELLERGDVAGPYYRINRLSGTPESGSIFVVFEGAIPRGVRVRSCTSHEGLHLTAWSGQPLKSRRLWHRYVYLGYDVEPSCQDADTRD
jgi:hypothetical protein